RGGSRSTFALLALFLCVGTGTATTFVDVDERRLARAADAIIIGTVGAIETVGNAEGGIHTLVTVDVETEYKGRVGGHVTLVEPGGRLTDRALWIAGSPAFRAGERQLLFPSRRRVGWARTTALGM